MDWQQLKEYLDQSYDFFDRIGVGGPSSQQSAAIHPVLKLSTSLALKAVSNASHNRLVILLPNRLHCAADFLRKRILGNPGSPFWSRFRSANGSLIHP